MFQHHYPTLQDCVLPRRGGLGDRAAAVAGVPRDLRAVARRDDPRGAARHGARPAGHLRRAAPVPRAHLGARQAGQWFTT